MTFSKNADNAHIFHKPLTGTSICLREILASETYQHHWYWKNAPLLGRSLHTKHVIAIQIKLIISVRETSHVLGLTAKYRVP